MAEIVGAMAENESGVQWVNSDPTGNLSMNIAKITTLILLLSLAACAAEDDTDEKADGEGMIKQAVDAQQVPKQKAEDLEQQIQEDFDKDQKEIDDQEG
jgi:hypothetical protein